eukprot:15013889-Alexandrium_andersonii.AAC.1
MGRLTRNPGEEFVREAEAGLRKDPQYPVAPPRVGRSLSSRPQRTWEGASGLRAHVPRPPRAAPPGI